MNTLWRLEEGSVREIRDALAAHLPRAYTTIMTIMDRLARKGVVARRKSGRAWVYYPNLSAEEARRHALGEVVQGFFGGSKTALLHHLGSTSREVGPTNAAAVPPPAPVPEVPAPRMDETLL